jgi:hypothetical protein
MLCASGCPSAPLHRLQTQTQVWGALAAALQHVHLCVRCYRVVADAVAAVGEVGADADVRTSRVGLEVIRDADVGA